MTVLVAINLTFATAVVERPSAASINAMALPSHGGSKTATLPPSQLLQNTKHNHQTPFNAQRPHTSATIPEFLLISSQKLALLSTLRDEYTQLVTKHNIHMAHHLQVIADFQELSNSAIDDRYTANSESELNRDSIRAILEDWFSRNKLGDGGDRGEKLGVDAKKVLEGIVRVSKSAEVAQRSVESVTVGLERIERRLQRLLKE